MWTTRTPPPKSGGRTAGCAQRAALAPDDRLRMGGALAESPGPRRVAAVVLRSSRRTRGVRGIAPGEGATPSESPTEPWPRGEALRQRNGHESVREQPLPAASAAVWAVLSRRVRNTSPGRTREAKA